MNRSGDSLRAGLSERQIGNRDAPRDGSGRSYGQKLGERFNESVKINALSAKYADVNRQRRKFSEMPKAAFSLKLGRSFNSVSLSDFVA